MRKLENFDWAHSFFELGTDFFQAKSPDPVAAPYLIDGNPEAAELIGLDPAEFKRKEFVEYFSGNRPLPGMQPLAMDYSGHQFGMYNPRLGDGRGLLLGAVKNGSPNTWDVYLKGCGPTRFARGFDGRATLRASIREYLGGEAVHGLGIPTTRSLAVIGIGELVFRETPQPGALLVRLSDTHVRFGSFENFHYTNRPEAVTRLADFVIQHHYPEIENEATKYQLLFRSVMQRTARLIAQWQSVGFIHGVMNTDNMTLTGTTFDYGPFGFMDRFNPQFTPNHTDGHGRYALGRQAEIGHWNLGKLGETMTHLIASEVITEELEQYQPAFNRFYNELMGQKLGLEILDSEFTTLVGILFHILYENQVDYTLFFRNLSSFPMEVPTDLRKGFNNPKDLDSWLALFRKLIEREDPDLEIRKEDMNQVNPKFILRSYLLERAIDKALKQADYSEVERLRILLQDPYNDRSEIFSQYGIDPELYAAETPESHIEMRLSCSA
jgi:uncharacterized protein YdiU (UPF0061 family)